MATLFGGCDGFMDNQGGYGDDQDVTSGISISGFAQKGQFIKGSSVTAFGLDSTLTATGASYPTSIKDDMGSFSLNAAGDAEYLEFRAEGYYFNENSGSLSETPIYLRALAEKSEAGVNINLLTTLTTPRIYHLVQGGMAFAEAKIQAQEELISAFKMDTDIAEVGFETLNITGGSDADAVLLAVSVLLQRDRSTADIQALIAEMSSEFETSGTFSEATVNGIFDDTDNFPVGKVIWNMVSYYEKKGITDFVIPPFHVYVNERFAEGVAFIEDNNLSATGLFPAEGCEGQLQLIADTEVSCMSDVDWMAVTVDVMVGNISVIRYEVMPNAGSVREGHILVKDRDGNIKEAVPVRQESGKRRIRIIDGETRSVGTRTLSSGDKVWINGVIYVLPEDHVVEVEDADIYRIGVPETVMGFEEDPYFCRVTFPETTYEIEDENISFGEVPPTRPGTKVPKFAVLKSFDGEPLPRYVEVEVKPCTAALRFIFKNFSSVSFIVVEADDEAILSGTAAYLYDDSLLDFDPTYIYHGPVCENASNKVRVYNTGSDNVISFVLMPQTLTSLKVSAYDEAGNLLLEKSTSNGITVTKGHIFSVSL